MGCKVCTCKPNLVLECCSAGPHFTKYPPTCRVRRGSSGCEILVSSRKPWQRCTDGPYSFSRNRKYHCFGCESVELEIGRKIKSLRGFSIVKSLKMCDVGGFDVTVYIVDTENNMVAA
ncbi:hypothetical protein FSP39_016863 [Pinctada imbricata]|uniref:Uncharacterized protein n=1 Tax=Pinctada imbricata TaxID=66713 RepID=A0AA89C1K0_PINIB|nr:hypothetical protein FSP39_016863 [Pinctada imbricata]